MVRRLGLGAAVAVVGDGATVISATAAMAAAVRVRVLVTSGLGGVTRGVAATYNSCPSAWRRPPTARSLEPPLTLRGPRRPRQA